MKKVYIATSGSYSDYSVEAVFAHKEDADKVAATLYDGDVLESYVYETVPEHITLYTRVHYKNGTEYESVSTKYPWAFDYSSTVDASKKRPSVFSQDEGHFTIEGFDKAQVDKAFQDEVMKLRAKQEGIAD